MMLIALLAQACAACIGLYLGFTNMLADHVLVGLERIGSLEEYAHKRLLVVQHNVPESTKQKPPSSYASSSPSDKLLRFSQTYAQKTNIPALLRESSMFQEALKPASQGAAIITTAITPPTRDDVEAALVNIFCQYKTPDYIRTTTGSGFVIDERGIILTNAHVAQFLLLSEIDKDNVESSCVVRAGNPAKPTYTADLLYISPTWVLQNANLIAEENPQGTGEYDYALLYISGRTDETPLPPTFHAIPLYTEYLSRRDEGDAVLTAGYPAEKLYREGARAVLVPVVATSSITEFYTFGGNYADIFTIANSAVGEHGASGGPVVRKNGTLGLIVTKGNAEHDGSRSLRALTLSYINRSIKAETSFSLVENTYGDIAKRGEIFRSIIGPFLSNLLQHELIQSKRP